MSRLGSLYIKRGEPDGELSGGCCEVDEWAATEIERMEADMLQARAIMLRWCSNNLDGMQIRQLERETLEFCRVKS